MPLLLIMGLGMQLTGWPEEFVALLAEEGFRVVRFDNRDAGLSDAFDGHGVPNLLWAAVRWRMGMSIPDAPYTIDDMAGDAVGVLDALGIGRAHVCGASMGGMVAQTLAARHPERVRSLTLMMTSSGARHLPQASSRVQRALLSRPSGPGLDAIAHHLEAFVRIISSPRYPPDPGWLHRRIVTAVRRSYRPAGTARQTMAIAAHGDRSRLLSRIVAPTVVIHGKDDVLVPVAAGHDLQRKIAGAEIDVVDGMGHDLPLQLLPRFTATIAALARRAYSVDDPAPEPAA